jgi:hypothetical protein
MDEQQNAGSSILLVRSNRLLDRNFSLDGSLSQCRVCSMPTVLFDEACLLKKYHVQYFRCTACGFIQTEAPYWLEEAYSSAIVNSDVGIMQRNLLNREVTSAILNLLYPLTTKAMDFGGGHGLLVRLMRDSGFNFFWYDRHANNDYARGFEYQPGLTYDFLTAFEVLEHLPNPIADLSRMMSLSQNVFVSTLLVPEPAPRVADWWYYGPSTGQHIAFYTTESLRLLAKRFDRSLLSNGSYHLFTKEPKNNFLFQLATKSPTARILNQFRRRPSLLESDYQHMIG